MISSISWTLQGNIQMSSPSCMKLFSCLSILQGLNLKIPKQRPVVTVAAKNLGNFFRSGSLDVVETESI